LQVFGYIKANPSFLNDKIDMKIQILANDK